MNNEWAAQAPVTVALIVPAVASDHAAANVLNRYHLLFETVVQIFKIYLYEKYTYEVFVVTQIKCFNDIWFSNKILKYICF